jgi:hypothetical protein
MFLWRSSNKALLLAALAHWIERRAGLSRNR